MKRMVIAGGTGFLGSVLTRKFKQYYEVVILTRGASGIRNDTMHIHWDGKTAGPWTRVLECADVLINLNGKSVDCRYNEFNKNEIYRTRIESTRILGKVLEELANPPRLWINASSATIYRHEENRDMDESTGVKGTGFSVDVCEQWEAAFNVSILTGTRKIALRTGIVLGKEGGPYLPMFRMVQFGLGGKQGNGHQYVSWLHEDDFAAAVDFLITHENCSGIYNLTSPKPVPNQLFMKKFRAALKRRIGLSTPRWLLEAGAWLIGTETELILKSRRVVPTRLLDAGFKFRYPEVGSALTQLVQGHQD